MLRAAVTMVGKPCGELIVVCEQAGVNKPWLPGYTCRGTVGTTQGRALLSALMTISMNNGVLECLCLRLLLAEKSNDIS